MSISPANNWNGGGGFDFGNLYHPQFNIVRAGVNYHFNWGGPGSGCRQVLIGGKPHPKRNPAFAAGFFFTT